MTLSPSPVGFVLDPTKREVLRQEKSNVQIRTTFLETSAALFITKHAIVESSTGTHRESSVIKEWNIGQIPRKEATSPTKSYSINATGSLMTPSSSSIYNQPKPSQESSTQHRQGRDEFISFICTLQSMLINTICCTNVTVCLLKVCLLWEIRFCKSIILSKDLIPGMLCQQSFSFENNFRNSIPLWHIFLYLTYTDNDSVDRVFCRSAL